MSLLTAQQILQTPDLKWEDVHVPEWKGTVRLKTLTGSERDQFDAETSGEGEGINLKNFRARLIAACAIDHEANPVFTPPHIEELGKKSGVVLDRLFKVAKRINAIGADAEEKAAKN